VLASGFQNSSVNKGRWNSSKILTLSAAKSQLVGVGRVNLQQIAFCERRIAEEEMLSRNASTRDDAAAHAQLALLYKAQLRLLLRMRPAKLAEQSCLETT